LIENVLALPRARLTRQALRAIDRLLRRALGAEILPAARALVVRPLIIRALAAGSA